MPCIERVMKMSGEFCSPEWLRESLRAGEKVLLMDCRPQNDYVRSHIKGAINVTLPNLMLRRLKKGNLKISCLIQNNEAKETFNRLWKTHKIVIYDECTTDSNSNPSSVVDLLMKKLRQDGANVSCLTGGFPQFEKIAKDLCRRTENTDESIFGLCNLKISDDSGNGTSESDSENLNSPGCMSPYPVEVLNHLYLGNAKNSADINLLKKFGIKYILNVTPNVPNKFAEDNDFKYMQIPVSDQLSQNLSAFFPEAIAFIDEARENGCGVLVHCLAGISRSVTVTVAYLMQKEHMSLNQAYDHVKGCKPNISPNFNFMGQLLDFEKTLSGDNTQGHTSFFCQRSNTIETDTSVRQT
ncbi:dual specificity protein phosphatase 7-like [Saccostrea echinata]|uniref:dual specificity protein phosphatase 7-like n=1 Tax=Saccostrea echinata TaxID=191078 RepID=UPI002A80554B|nr:dual specificity protein phosphatase 7-like [Saccostrea echinata]